MIEILVALAIMVILLTIFAVAYKNVGTSSERNQTQTLVERLKNATVEVTNTKEGAAKFYEVQLPAIYYGQAAYAGWLGVPAGSVESFERTGRVLRLLSSNPSAKAIIDEVPTERKKNITINGQTYLFPLDAWNNPILFVFDNLQRPTGGGVSVPFTVAGPRGQVQVGGLTQILSGSAKEYWGTRTMTPAVVYADSHYGIDQSQPTFDPPTDYAPHIDDTVGNTPAAALTSPDRRPFWFSAGPDGKYQTHDDNVYSFGN